MFTSCWFGIRFAGVYMVELGLLYLQSWYKFDHCHLDFRCWSFISTDFMFFSNLQSCCKFSQYPQVYWFLSCISIAYMFFSYLQSCYKFGQYPPIYWFLSCITRFSFNARWFQFCVFYIRGQGKQIRAWLSRLIVRHALGTCNADCEKSTNLSIIIQSDHETSLV